MGKLDYFKIKYCPSKDSMKMKKQGKEWEITATTPKIYFVINTS